MVDGTGGSARRENVFLQGDKIVGFSQEIPKATNAEIIDVSGLVVAPGFIDIHSHSDYTLLVDPRASSSIHQGVTTEVIGNCGFGCFPLRNHELAPMAIYGVSDAIALDWSSPGEYLERLESARPAVNVLTLVPNGQLRLSAIGLADRPASAEETATMSRDLEEGLAEGAWGYSTGLEYSAEIGATEEEVLNLCQITARAGGLYATHTRARDEGAGKAVAEAVRTARSAEVRLQISHLLPRSGPHEAQECLRHVDDALASGQDIGFDMHTRQFGLTYLHTLLPPWAVADGKEALLSVLRDPSGRARMRAHRSILSAGNDWSRVTLLDNPRWQEYARRSLGDIARERNQDPFDTAFDLLLDSYNDASPLMATINCYDAAAQESIFSHPLCIPGSDATALALDGPLGDTSFHGAYTWASWYFRFMVKERAALSMEEAIHRLTGRPAAVLGLSNRGVLQTGTQADIMIFDPDRFGERGTTFEPNQLAVGVEYVFVNGASAMSAGLPTGNHSGRVLKKLRERGQI